MKSARFNVAFLLLSHVAGCAFAHSYFTADLKMDNGTSVGNAQVWIHDGEWAWEVNTTVPMSTVEIFYRGDAANPETDLVDMVKQNQTVGGDKVTVQKTPTGDVYLYAGAFDETNFEREKAPNLFEEDGDLTDSLQLAGFMCMDRMSILWKTADGVTRGYAPLIYGSEEDCYEGTNTTSMRLPMSEAGGIFATVFWSLATVAAFSMT